MDRIDLFSSSYQTKGLNGVREEERGDEGGESRDGGVGFFGVPLRPTPNGTGIAV